jgi:hypothetical protein
VDKAVDAVFGVEVGGVEVRAEVVEVEGWVGEQVPDDDENGPGDGDEGLEFAAAFDQASVAFAEEGVGFGGAGGGPAQRAFEVGVAFAGFPAPGDPVAEFVQAARV